MSKSEKIQGFGCALCGAPLSNQSGLLRCSDKSCGHLHKQGYAFETPATYVPASRYPEYERQTPKPVDEEML